MLTERRASFAGDALVVVVAKLLVSGLVWASGFRAVSDDDFARVVLAQAWAEAPRLDPTGTSWLPLPFWVTGGAMRLAGNTSLGFARGVAVALGLVSAVLVLGAARLLARDRRAALIGALLACAFPWSARLGVAPVPELPTAALSVFAVATLVSSSGRMRVAGGFALLLAVWSRYEPWPLALAFVALQVLPGFGVPRSSVRSRVLSCGLALFGPFAWLLHNKLAHGDALHFLARVSAYKRALGGDDPSAVAAYPLALLREEPELWLVALAALALSRGSGLRSLRAPVCALGAMVLALSLAASRGGAPTHHNGRALLAVWLALAIVVGAQLDAVLRRPGAARLGLAAVIFAVVPFGAFVLRPWYARLDSMADREVETRIGARTRALVDRGPVLLEVRDFGFFAIQAGSGSPGMFVLDRILDPRDPTRGSSFRDAASLRERLETSGARYILATETPAALVLGEPLFGFGPWRLWSCSSAPP